MLRVKKVGQEAERFGRDKLSADFVAGKASTLQ
jgi:hypothetical protein